MTFELIIEIMAARLCLIQQKLNIFYKPNKLKLIHEHKYENACIGKKDLCPIHLMPVNKSDVGLTGYSWHGKHFGVTQKEEKERVTVGA